MRFSSLKKCIGFILAVIIILSTVFVSDVGISTSVNAEKSTKVAATSYWNGFDADEFASGTGTSNDPFIIETADQLYKMVRGNGKLDNGNVAYYKVADGVTSFYLNNVENLSQLKELVKDKNYKNWETSEAFCGVFDGNGSTIYGMVSYKANGFVYALDESYATIKNVHFDSCYVYSDGNAAIITTRIGSYLDKVLDLPFIANVSVMNSYIETGRNITVNNGNHSPSAAGFISTNDTAKELRMYNCFFDGYSCQLVQGSKSTADATAGIVSCNNSFNNATLNACVSLNAQVFPQAQGANYTRYDINNNSGFQVFAYGCYSSLVESVRETAVSYIEGKPIYEIFDMPVLNWLNGWELVNDGARQYPMPKNFPGVNSETIAHPELISKQNNNGGAYNVFGGAYKSGTYGMYHALVGSGTKEDPYIIYDAFQLARAIASGGKNLYNQVYYKLACDIDASQARWISQDDIGAEGSEKYKYVPFSGILDGNGHVVYGIYGGDDESMGLIPVLAADGVVKNLHIRDSAFVSGGAFAGAIAGESESGALIEGCSVESSQIYSKEANSFIVGNKGATIKNSYYVLEDGKEAEYYNKNGKIGAIDVSKDNDVWYLGGKQGSTPRLKNHAATRKFADVDGDGIAEGYSASDLVALRHTILAIPGYENGYGDVNSDGMVNVSDLAILQRHIISDYDKLYDGFWRNANLGKINIYYGENDNYDAARRLEIYLEAKLDNIDIKKIVSASKTVSGTESDKNSVYVHADDLVDTPKGTLEIIVGDISNYSAYSKNDLAVNDYAISYDEENCVLWFKGGSFTGVEQAVIDFIEKSDEKTSSVYTVERATLSPEKQAKTVMVDTNYDGKADTEKVFYYAWGDEFDGVIDAPEGEDDQLNIDTWNISRMNTETLRGKAGTYNNVETANETEISQLYKVENGKITITRGVKAEYATSESDKLNYVRLYNQEGKTALSDDIDDEDIIANPGLIKANHSMLYKQGYAEMYGSLPSDGHTFASWWMLGHGEISNNAIDETLYGKVYKHNNTGDYAYDGTTTWPISTDPKTFKYQLPTNYFEIDVWELMQSCTLAHSSYQKTRTTGSYDYRLYLNVHKFYSVGSRSQPTVNVIDWDNPSTPRAVMKKEWFGTPKDDYYFSTSAAYKDFTSGSTTRYTKDILGRVTAKYSEALQKQLTAPRRYGFYWDTNGVDKFNFTLYIYDVNGDGVEGDDAILGTSKMTYNTQDKMKPSDYDIVPDAEVANQYMYFLFDNVLYTSNANHNNATSESAVMFTDFLTNEGTQANPDKIDLEIDYIRVYQYDGRRDIITRETETFNNGNHFGY